MTERKFSKNFDDVLTQAYLFQSELLVDLADFTAASPLFDVPYPANFLVDIEAADALPTNEDDLNMQSLYSQQVEEKMEEGRVHYQKLLLYVGTTWQDDFSILKIFGNSLYLKARQSPQRLINLLQNGYISANSPTYKADLIAAGFVQVDITLLETLANDLTGIYNDQQDFIRHSFKRSEDRIKAFNKVWDSMVKISNFSKLIFKDSPAKVEYYLLYPETPTSNPPGVPELSYSPDGFSWDEVLNATSYELVYRASSDIEWIELYAGPFPEGSIAFNPGEGDWVARLRARNSGGYGDWSEERAVFIGLHAPQNVTVVFTGAPDNFLRVSWSSVTGADFIEIWSSVVALGQPAGTYAKVGQLPSSPFQQVATLAMRYYYYLIAKSAEYTSPASETVYYDVPV